MVNVVTMLLYLVGQYMKPTGIEAAAVQVTPPTGDRRLHGCVHGTNSIMQSRLIGVVTWFLLASWLS